jgi:hypothetical protein
MVQKKSKKIVKAEPLTQLETIGQKLAGKDAFELTMCRQQIDSNIAANVVEIQKLGRKINESLEMKKIKELKSQNLSLGQQKSIVQNMIDKDVLGQSYKQIIRGGK